MSNRTDHKLSASAALKDNLTPLNSARIYAKPAEQTVEMTRITPETAAEWLASSRGKNWRKISPKHVDTIADDIRKNGWKQDGNAFKFDTNGEMVDGQHRAAAIVKEKVTVFALVIRGLPVDSAENIDCRGRSRTTAQRLQAMGIPYYKESAAIIWYLAAYWQDTLGWPQNASRSISEDLKILRDKPGILAAAAAVGARMTRRKSLHLSRGAIGLIYFLASETLGKEIAERFLEALVDGIGVISERDPLLVLKRRLESLRGARGGLPGRFRMALLIKAWNAWIEGREVAQLSWRGGGPTAEPFPQICLEQPSDKDPWQ